MITATTTKLSHRSVSNNKLYKKESFKYSFLQPQDNKHTLENIYREFLQVEKEDKNSQVIDFNEDELEDIEYMLF